MYLQKVKNLIYLVEKLRNQQKKYFDTRLAFRDSYHQEVSEWLEQKVDASIQELLNDIKNG